MPTTAYTSTYFQVYGAETVSLSDLPMSAQTYAWDFRSQILESESSVPLPDAEVVSRQIIGWVTADIPNLSIRTSTYNLAGAAAKIGSFAWGNQGYIYTGGFLNYQQQFLGNVTLFDIDDTIPSLDGVSDFSYFALPGLNGLPADKLLISLSGGLPDGATVSIVWALQRNAVFGSYSNPVITYTGNQL